jgi:hypothetical protein
MGKNIWFLKATRFNRGRGIYVFDSLEKMKLNIAEMKDGDKDEKILSPLKKPNGTSTANLEENKDALPKEVLKSTSFVIQKYIESPLLIKKRKFDI